MMKKLKSALLLCALAMGLAGCSEDKDDRTENEPIYGVPTVTFSVSGYVTDGKAQPVVGINVKFRNDTETYTDTDGIFEFKHCRTFGVGGEHFSEYLEFRDVDGAANGSFKERKVYVTFTRDEEVKTGGGYNGDYRAHPIGVLLRKTAEEENEEE